MTEVEPVVADEVPWADSLTPYDEARLLLYLRLLDAEAQGADWHEVAAVVLGRDVVSEPERARLCWESHLERARWIAQKRYDEGVRGDR